MKYIRRTLQKELKKSVEEYSVTAVLGPRQSGKTTLAVKTFPNKKYISLEDIEAREFALKDPKNFLQTYTNGAILDEVQRCPRSSDCGIAQNTVKSWLSVLESSFMIKLLYPYYKNFKS